MGMSRLVLQLEYNKFPEYFDVHNVTEDTEVTNGLIERILKKHGVETVLDLTCGTGSQVFFLEKRGYKVTGADFSPALLEIARERAVREKVDIRFIDGDMRTLKVGDFDAVITIFNAIGHLTKFGFEKALKNIYRNLKEGGIYVFDILNLEAMTDSAVADLAYYVHKKVNDTQIHTTQCSTIDREKGILTSYDSYVIQKNADKPETFKHKFALQLYTSEELSEVLGRNGFEVVEQKGMDGEAFIEEETRSILTVGKKRG